MEQIVFRKNQLKDLQSLISGYDTKKVFLVRDNLSYSISGAESFIHQLLKRNIPVAFYNFDPNPEINDLKKGIDLFKSANYDIIIAIGGGSVLDMAKLISVFAYQKGAVDDIIMGKLPVENLKTPLLAIPTTAGTGAEATEFSVLYIDKKKYSISNSNIRPDYVYLSSEFSLSTSPYLTACTGLDAFCQAIESVWSVKCNNESEEYALQSIEIIWNNLQKAVQDNDKKAKEQMQEASFLSGEAINITTTTAPHALSYAFTSYYNIPHGHAVALSLPYFLDFNYSLLDNNCTDPRGPENVKERIDKVLKIMNLNINEAPVILTQYFKTMNIEMNIQALINNFNPDIIIDNINTERISNNPRKVTKEDLKLFLYK